jgi:tetratricopeptide (TPR) repeat protein
VPQRAALHIAFACSGGAALVYEIVWTRLLTLYIGHTVAAASTVLAAFMGGLAFGAALAGRRASALDRRTAIRLYAALEILVAVSRLLAGRGQFVAAAEPLRAAFQSPHPDMRAMDQLASVFADAGDLPRLASIVKQLEQVAPDSEATVYYSAALQFMSGHADDALHIVSRFPPKTARQLNLAGAAYGATGRAEEARQAFLQSLQADPRDPATYANLGELEMDHGNPKLASRYVAEAIILDATSARARDGLAKAIALRR